MKLQLELPIEWLSWAQVAGVHLPTSVFESERMLVGGRAYVMYSGASPFSASYGLHSAGRSRKIT